MKFIKEITTLAVCLNDEDKIGISLQSLRDQFKGKIICVDGGSKDKSVFEAGKYADVVLKTKQGIQNQYKAGFELVDTKYILLIESDHYYPKNFLKDFISQYENSDFDVMQAKVSINNPRNIFEYFHKLFQKVHQIYPVKRYDISEPSIWPKDILSRGLNSFQNIQGYSFDTALFEFLEKNEIKSCFCDVYAYEDTFINFGRFLNRHINYGKGDYDFLVSNISTWDLPRIIKSVTHVAKRYWIEYPIRVFKFKINIILIPYLYIIGFIRYFGFLSKFLMQLKKILLKTF